MPTIPWAGLKENPMLNKTVNNSKLSIEYLWTNEILFAAPSGKIKYRVIERFKPTDGQKNSEEMINELFSHLIQNTNCKGFMKRVQSNKGLVFIVIAKADNFDNKDEYSNLINSKYLTL